MKRFLIFGSAAVVLIAAAAGIGQWFNNIFDVDLTGYEEVPAVSTVGYGDFRAEFGPYNNSVSWQLVYRDLEGDVTQAHIHLGQKNVNGGIAVFLCSNLGNGPAGTQPCPASPGMVTGTFRAADLVGPAAQGLAPGEFSELVRAMREGVTYVNVHSTKFPGGEVRSQLIFPQQDNRNGFIQSSAHSGH